MNPNKSQNSDISPELSGATGSAPSPHHCPKCGRLKLTRTGKPHKCAPPAGWQPADTAPKNGFTMILGDFGWPWPIPAVWDQYGGEWCVVTVQSSPMQDGPANSWLEIDHERQLKRWHAIPPLPNGSDEPHGRRPAK